MKHEMSGKFCAMAAIVMGVWTSPLSAGPALLFDASTQMVLYAEDHDDLRHPASRRNANCSERRLMAFLIQGQVRPEICQKGHAEV
jgi:hypothetical protein